MVKFSRILENRDYQDGIASVTGSGQRGLVTHWHWLNTSHKRESLHLEGKVTRTSSAILSTITRRGNTELCILLLNLAQDAAICWRDLSWPLITIYYQLLTYSVAWVWVWLIHILVMAVRNDYCNEWRHYIRWAARYWSSTHTVLISPTHRSASLNMSFCEHCIAGMHLYSNARAYLLN